MKKLDLRGQSFGRLTALHESGRTRAGLVRWTCLCACGNSSTVTTNDLRKGHVRSCGCLRIEQARSLMSAHGASYRRAYWSAYVAKPKPKSKLNLTVRFPRKNRRELARDFVLTKNARTVCAHCGRQPIEWHNRDHVEQNREDFRISALVRRGATISDIQDEMERCTPLCRRCHMQEDGRLQNNLANGRLTKPPRFCSTCAEQVTKPLRRGLCGRCYSRQYRPSWTVRRGVAL